MTATRTISATAFKAHCLDILDQVAGHLVERVIITQRGQAVAVLTAPVPLAESEDLHGCMRGSVLLPPDLDLTAPVLDKRVSAEDGKLHG